MKRIYLDHNAATELDPNVYEAYLKALSSWGNPSSTHREGQKAKGLLEEARALIAKDLHVASEEVYFFSSATEGLNTLIRGMLIPESGKGHIITSGQEHAAVYECCRALEKEGHEVTFLKTGERAPSAEDLEETIGPHTTGIALMSVNNETGLVTDVEALGKIAMRHNIPLLVDAVAHLGKMPFRMYNGISAVCFASYKIHAPKGTGCVVLGKGARCRPLILGGGQEKGLRSGTENASSIYAFSQALHLFIDDKDSFTKMEKLRDRFEKGLQGVLSGVLINGQGARVSNTSNLSFTGVDGESLLIQLDLQGISSSHGAACASGALEASRVLLEMGYSMSRALSSLRFSLGKETTEEEIDRAVSIIQKLVTNQRILSEN